MTASYEAMQLHDAMGSHAAADLIDRMGLLLSHIADTIRDDGDLVALNSTNDADRIRAIAEEWRHLRYKLHDAETNK